MLVVVALVLGVAVPVVHVVDVVAVGYGVVPAAFAVLVGVARVRDMFQGSLVVVAVVRAMRVAVVDVVGVIAVVDGDVAAALAVLVRCGLRGCRDRSWLHYLLLLRLFLTVLDRVGGDVGDVGESAEWRGAGAGSSLVWPWRVLRFHRDL